MTATAHIRISHFDDMVPPFAEAELERLYGSLFSSLAHFRIYGGAENASTCVMQDGDNIVGLLLFRREHNTVRVINEWIEVGAAQLNLFADYIFATFPSVSVIAFRAVRPDIASYARPYQTLASSENIRVTLPQDTDSYIASLGSATRKNIKRHKNKLERTFPSFNFRTYTKDDADEQHIRDIIRFNGARMAHKGLVSNITEQDTESLIRMVKERGFVTVAMIDGRVCGGAITFQIGDTYVSRVNAHDPAYDDHRLGTICCFLTICACIERGAKRFDFMWTKYDYKTALLGVHYDLFDLVVYRSLLHQAVNGRLALKFAFASRVRAAKQWLLDAAAPGTTGLPGLAGRGVQLVRRIKRLRNDMPGTPDTPGKPSKSRTPILQVDETPAA